MSRIAVVIPAYNEAATIGAVAKAACTIGALVIVVDDGSADGTSGCLDTAAVTLLRNDANCGKGASLWRGMQQALALGAEAIVTLDGDGQHPPERIGCLVAAHQEYPERVIIAARMLERQRMPETRRFGNEVADFWISWAAGCPIFDSQSGFRLYPAALLANLHLRHGRSRSFVFESEILIEAARRGFRPLAVPIEAVYHNQARRSHYRPWLDTVRIISMVAGKLIRRGMDPAGLICSRRHRPEVYRAQAPSVGV
ncbi:MAG: glycosyltransferase family 2 protein [Rhodospirillales bacterium]|nr:glycosyltransferase family 2 protein [Rhodospirillales bacterium]